jgi:signal transduction histidine kinase
LVVQDDGRGFRTDVERRAGTRSIGLMLMQERADAIGANLIIESAPGTGTRVVVEMAVTGLPRGKYGLE